MDKYNFDLDKIADFLKDYKDNLSNLYTWNAKIKIDELVDLNTQSLSDYDKEIILRKKINLKLNEFYKTDENQFNSLCLWIIKVWGGISTAEDPDTIKLVNEFLESEKPNYNRIASSSKVGAYMYPDKYIIYDSRVAYSLNWIILSRNAGNCFFPIPSGRNSKMMAFDMNVLIRLKNINCYSPTDISEMDKKQYIISKKDKSVYIPKEDAYSELNKLIKKISIRLWDHEKAKMLYYTEMLLFAIADRDIYVDITNSLSLNIKTKC